MRLLLLCVLAACEIGSAPMPRGPHLPWSAQDKDVRIQMYRDYRLTAQAGIGTWLVRADGKHSYLEMRDVLGEYPRSRALYESARLRDSVLGLLGCAGTSFGFVAGFDQLTGAEGLSQTGRNGFYVISGALFAGTIVAALLWDDPIDRIPATYNAELSADLGLGLDISSAGAVGNAGSGRLQ